ncbi:MULTISPECIES: hypothetical protein [Paraburkholderia]|uniref:hypothetical protein n=1 Tax=Paraburkholderia TaxID=1822464 RepID=UPI0022500845|nr:MULTISPECIES: hypothetical protein [Paraburkholderia]MCX4153066.1 hypothetical protein [Paraburkholderia aspalathi]MDN7162480.1 hypothetical protein [Paraburkholderia sp. SECH2]MDQ6390966.1 hypothetical protein [Paraburkholderia aspalathi]
MATALFDLLDRLDAAKIHYTLSRNRPDAVLVSIAVVGMRVEVDVFRNGCTEVCVFKGPEGEAEEPAILERIIRENAD